MQAMIRVEEICLAVLQARDFREVGSALSLLCRGLDDYPSHPALLVELADLARDPRCRAEVKGAVLRALEREARAAGEAPIAHELWLASAQLRHGS